MIVYYIVITTSILAFRLPSSLPQWDLGLCCGHSPNIITRLTTQPLENMDCVKHLSSAKHVSTSGSLKPTVDCLAKRPDRTFQHHVQGEGLECNSPLEDLQIEETSRGVTPLGMNWPYCHCWRRFEKATPSYFWRCLCIADFERCSRILFLMLPCRSMQWVQYTK